jgi:hypothetical protein
MRNMYFAVRARRCGIASHLLFQSTSLFPQVFMMYLKFALPDIGMYAASPCLHSASPLGRRRGPRVEREATHRSRTIRNGTRLGRPHGPQADSIRLWQMEGLGRDWQGWRLQCQHCKAFDANGPRVLLLEDLLNAWLGSDLREARVDVLRVYLHTGRARLRR